jgi:hypothetical protein
MKTIERLIRKNATEVGMWEPTHYLSLKQARDLNPGEYPGHFRVATGEPAHPKSSGMPWCERCQCWHHASAAEHIRFGKPGEEYIAPVAREYEGQAHHMSKAANSLVGVLTALDYSKFTTEDAALYTTNFHAMINSLMAAQDSEHLSVTRPDGQVVRVTVPKRESKPFRLDQTDGRGHNL